MSYILEYTCGYGYSKCASGYDCFSAWEKCNGVLNCKDGSDEDLTVCKGIIISWCCVSNEYANIVVRVEDIVHDPKGSALCLQPWPLFGIVSANTTLLLLLCWLLYVNKIYWELLQ